MDRQRMMELADLISKAVVKALQDSGLVFVDDTTESAPHHKKEKTAYQKTEALLFNYNNFRKIVEERKQEINDIRKYGVPRRNTQYGEVRVRTSRNVQGIVLEQDAVENAVRTVEATVQETVQALNLMDNCMAALKNDPYYEVLPMRYFEGRTLEDIGSYFGVDHTTISRNKRRLVKELAMRLFPDEVTKEIMH